VSTDRRYPVEITARLKRQLWFWHTMIRVCAVATKIPAAEERLPVWALDVFTDAAGGSTNDVGRGAGIVCGPWWTYIGWSWKINNGVRALDGKKLSKKLSALELVGPLACLASGASWCQGRQLRFWVDNSGSVRIWQKGYSSSCGLCTTLVKAMSTVAAALGTRLDICKIRRCSNTGAKMADALSKAEFREFFALADSNQWPVQQEAARVSKAVLQWVCNPVEDDDLGCKILAELQLAGIPMISL